MSPIENGTYTKLSLNVVIESVSGVVHTPFEDDIRMAYTNISEWLVSSYSILSHIENVNSNFTTEDKHEIVVLLQDLKRCCALVKNRINEIEQYAREQAVFVESDSIQRSNDKVRTLTRKIDSITKNQLAA